MSAAGKARAAKTASRSSTITAGAGNSPSRSSSSSRSSGSSSGGSSSTPKYQIVNLAAMAKYSPSQYQRTSSGAVVLNPGVTPISGTVKSISSSSSGSTSSPKLSDNQIINLDSMSKYTADQYERLDDGRVMLKDGVTVKDGTTKKVSKEEKEKIDEEQEEKDDIEDDFKEEDLPDYILEDPAYKNLPQEIKDLIALNYLAQTSQNADYVERAKLALEEASKVVDPYIKEAVRMTQEELDQAVGGVKKDAQSQIKTLNNRMDAIKEDLTYNKEQLTLEQQADLSNQLRSYENDLFSLQQGAAEAGLAFSSPRARAETGLAAENQAIVESTQRKYNRAVREQDVSSARDITELKQSVVDTARTKRENLEKLALAAEGKLGSDRVPEGLDKIGDITGSLEYKKGEMTTNLQRQLLDDKLNLQ